MVVVKLYGDTIDTDRRFTLEKIDDLRDQRLEFLKPCPSRDQHDDTQAQRAQILLMLDSLVSSDECIETCIGGLT
jgi:hypothetical protein